MKKYFLLINVIVGFSCSTATDQQVVIPESQMVELLVDIHILEARVDKLRVSNDSSFTIYNTLESEIFEKYGVSKEEYEHSFQYYLAHSKLMDHIYGIVVDSLNVIQKRGYQYKSELVELDSSFVENPISKDDIVQGKTVMAKDKRPQKPSQEKIEKASVIDKELLSGSDTSTTKGLRSILRPTSRDSLQVKKEVIKELETTQDSLK